MFYSQIRQDEFIDNFFNHKSNGIFLDIGANDGILLSNTYFFEKEKNWTGICIEPRTEEYVKLIQNRKCYCVNSAISNCEGTKDFLEIKGHAAMLSGLSENYDVRHLERIRSEMESGGKCDTIQIQVTRLQTILNKFNIHNIDYCSIDVEGAELDVIKSIDFGKTQIKIFTIENNYNTNEVRDYLKDYNYTLYTKLEIDDVFVKD